MRSKILEKLGQKDGVGLVSAMLALSLLAVFALVAASLAVNERRTAFNDLVHTSAFLSADSGGEAAIAWLRSTPRPPAVNLATNQVRSTANVPMDLDPHQRFSFDIQLQGTPRPRVGYDADKFRDFMYSINSQGEAGDKGESNIGVIVSKLSLVNYN